MYRLLLRGPGFQPSSLNWGRVLGGSNMLQRPLEISIRKTCLQKSDWKSWKFSLKKIQTSEKKKRKKNVKTKTFLWETSWNCLFTAFACTARSFSFTDIASESGESIQRMAPPKSKRDTQDDGFGTCISCQTHGYIWVSILRFQGGGYPPRKFNMFALKKWCLEDDHFLLGVGNFSRGEVLNFGSASTLQCKGELV